MSDNVHWFVNELGARIVAQSGTANDRFHIGKLILQSLKDAPDFVAQINGATDERITNQELLKRSIGCALLFRTLGLRQGDVVVIIVPNHLDVGIPFYAGLFEGLIVAPFDRYLELQEVKKSFVDCRPRVVFCQSENVKDVQSALLAGGYEALIYTFDRNQETETLKGYLDKCSDKDVESFRPAEFDAEETIAFLISTSGSTGASKYAAVTHKSFFIQSPYWWVNHKNYPTPTSLSLVLSPLQWLTVISHFTISPMLRYTMLVSSSELTKDHIQHLIRKYKPTHMISSSHLMAKLLNQDNGDVCDISCFESLVLGGGAVPMQIVEEIKRRSTNTYIANCYGLTEASGCVLMKEYRLENHVGKPLGCYHTRLIDVDTQKDITEPFVRGELWLKGPGLFKGYYNDPEASEKAFSSDGWLKTGDLFYRDENKDYHFVDRLKLLMKYKSQHISPLEMEAVIRQYPGVLDVVVTSKPDLECGELLVACVIPRPDGDVTEQQIKQLVKETLTDNKQLRGGVIFMEQFPFTATNKINRFKLKQIVSNM